MRFFEEIMIDRKGFMSLKRKGQFRENYCPYGNVETLCGDYCPHFSEPDEANCINLCHGTFVTAGKIIDKRP